MHAMMANLPIGPKLSTTLPKITGMKEPAAVPLANMQGFGSGT
jgi:hypothetical protein